MKKILIILSIITLDNIPSPKNSYIVPYANTSDSILYSVFFTMTPDTTHNYKKTLANKIKILSESISLLNSSDSAITQLNRPDDKK
jgi:hypothetical protein